MFTVGYVWGKAGMSVTMDAFLMLLLRWDATGLLSRPVLRQFHTSFVPDGPFSRKTNYVKYTSANFNKKINKMLYTNMFLYKKNDTIIYTFFFLIRYYTDYLNLKSFFFVTS